ncbi:hypothetical cytosolic protein [Streptococcus sanguinis SK1057]|nr:T7SS effector LXG polymorphic toxin [Streptococcus sanguinis]EGF06591.1 hypothetical cytosolic protein [Streptococcus sanguinis SK1057]
MSDGFYVDVDELYTVFEELQSQSEKIISSLEAAKSSYNSVITSNSMYGDVGQAIAGEINSSHNMLLMQLKDLLYSLQSDFSKEVESFQSATGEKSSTAIISHSYLKSTGVYFDTQKGEIDQIRKTINSATDSVSDLVSVTSDAKNYEYFGGNLSNAKDVVTNTIEKVSAWDSQGTALTTETSLQNLQELLGQLHQTDGLDYSDPIISQVVNNLSPIADKVKEIDDQIDESVQKAKLEAQKAKELEEKERDRIEKDWRLHHPIQATLRDWRKGLSDGLDNMTNWMKDNPNWKWLKGFGDAAFGAVGDAVFGVAEFGVDLVQYTSEGVILGYNSLMGNETPQWMKDDLQGGIETFGNVILNTLGNAFGLVTMIPEVNNLINDLDNSTRDGSIMGAILHDVRHAKDLMQQPIHDKFNKAAQFSGYDSGYAAGEIVSEIVSWIGPAKLFKMAGGGKLVSRLAQMPKIQKGISYFRKARTMLANSHLGMLARESYGATKNFFTSRFGNLWDDFSRTKFAFAGLDDFRYADDIGKHTARLYQSTGEGAEYQRLRQKLYSEAAEHGDDVAKVFKETIEQPHPEVHWKGHKWESHLEELHKKMLADNVPVTAEVHTVEEIAKQQAEILKVRYGEEALSSSLKKGNFGEMVQDEYYRQFGYERISKDMVTGLDDAGRQGIDGVYYNPNGHPPYIISEAKYNTAKLGKTADGRQMSERWIRNRLKKAVDSDHYIAIRKAQYMGDIQNHLFNIKKNGDIIINQLDDAAKKMK